MGQYWNVYGCSEYIAWGTDYLDKEWGVEVMYKIVGYYICEKLDIPLVKDNLEEIDDIFNMLKHMDME